MKDRKGSNKNQKKERIIISATSDLSTDQRVLKVANSCHTAGYEVMLYGRELKGSRPLELPFSFKRIKLLFNKSVFFYAEYNIRLFFRLLFSQSDIFISNDTDTLLANFCAASIRRKKLVFDAHELFPEVPELSNRPTVKKIWTKIEDFIFPKLHYSYTVCESIAEYYNKRYKMQMAVVRNIPTYRTQNKEKKLSYKNKKIILYQGALNIGRGIEWVIDAMPNIQNAVFVIIGDGDIKESLKRQTKTLKVEDKVIFLGKIPGKELHEYTPSADIGLCLLENKGLSYYYALPNRVFDYLQAGVPILATDFPEIARIVKTHQTGRLISSYEPLFLAQTINEMLERPMNTDHFKELSKKLCWENEEKILIDILKKATKKEEE